MPTATASPSHPTRAPRRPAPNTARQPLAGPTPPARSHCRRTMRSAAAATNLARTQARGTPATPDQSPARPHAVPHGRVKHGQSACAPVNLDHRDRRRSSVRDLPGLLAHLPEPRPQAVARNRTRNIQHEPARTDLAGMTGGELLYRTAVPTGSRPSPGVKVPVLLVGAEGIWLVCGAAWLWF